MYLPARCANQYNIRTVIERRTGGEGAAGMICGDTLCASL
jgi:hypothetical protein